MAKIVIIGAGLTGLSAAYHLEQQNFFDYNVFEKNDKPGGLLQSIQENGFTFDFTGHLLHINDVYFKEFLHQKIASLDDFNIIERKAAIFSHNIFTDYPFQINLHGLPTDVIVECIEGYVNRTHSNEPKNYHEWILKHFGAGMGKHFFFPYNKKILSYDLKKIHPAQSGRFVPGTNLQAILKGTIEKKPPSGIGYNSNFYYPKQGGIEFIIQQLIKKLKRPVLTQHKVSYVDTHAKTIFFENGHKEQYTHLISTMPLNQLLPILPKSSPLHTVAPKLLCNSVMNINLGFSCDKLSDFHWIYFPEKMFPLYRLGFWHNINKASVPHGRTAIYGELSYLASKTSLKQAEQQVRRSIKKTLNFLGLTENHLIIEKILSIPHAYVIYDAWREKNLPKIQTQLNELNIHSIGRYGGWKYSSMQEAVLDGKQSAEYLYEIMQNSLNKIIPARYDQQNNEMKAFKNLTI